MFDIQSDGLYDASKICVSENAVVISFQTVLETVFFFVVLFFYVVAKKRKIDCSVDRDHHL